MGIAARSLDFTGIPVFELDVEYGTRGTPQMEARVQAFLEMINEEGL